MSNKFSYVLKVKTLCRILTLTVRSATHSTLTKSIVSAVDMSPEGFVNASSKCSDYPLPSDPMLKFKALNDCDPPFP